MQKVYLFAGAAIAAAVAYAAYISWPRDVAVTAPPAQARAAASPSVPAARAPSTAPAAQPAEPTAANEPSHEAGDGAIDDGDFHETAQLPVKPLETPPPSAEAFGADPQSQTAALDEARGILQALQQESDPEVKAQVAKLLQSIDAAR